MAEVISRRDGPIATVVISNPTKMNAVTPEMWQALAVALDDFDADPAIRVIVVTGAGDKAFVSGADIGRFDTPAGARTDPKGAPYMSPARCKKPVIAKIRGYCFGGGLGLASACDLRFASDDATFRMPAARLGIGYSAEGVQRYIELIGATNTLDIFISARRFDAADALRMGFVSRVVPAAELDRTVDEYCAMVAENAPLTQLAAKRTITEFLKEPAARDPAAVDALIAKCLASADFKEGRKAFMEKRKPDFTGR